jgi:hypothetical protein
MVKPHLISTSAHINDSNRVLEYIDSYKQISEFKDSFKSITIIETISETKLEYLENTDLPVLYSGLGNSHPNKGVNWLHHVTNFLLNSEINDDEIVIFITGRYNLINTNILSLIETHMVKENFDFIAKEDDDLYVGEIHGVHTFFMAFTKAKFLDFSSWYRINGQTNDCIEWDVKRFMLTNDKCLILPKTIIMGVQTRVFTSTSNKIC